MMRRAPDHPDASVATGCSPLSTTHSTRDAMSRKAFSPANVKIITQDCLHVAAQSGEVQEYSDTLVIFLLKARRPEKFKDRAQIDKTETINVNITVDDQRRAKGMALLL